MLKTLTLLYCTFIRKQLTTLIHVHISEFAILFHWLICYLYFNNPITVMNVVLINLEVTRCYSFNFSFLFQVFVLGILHFHIPYSIALLTSTKKKFTEFYWILLNEETFDSSDQWTLISATFIDFTCLSIFVLLKEVPF